MIKIKTLLVQSNQTMNGVDQVKIGNNVLKQLKGKISSMADNYISGIGAASFGKMIYDQIISQLVHDPNWKEPLRNKEVLSKLQKLAINAAKDMRIHLRANLIQQVESDVLEMTEHSINYIKEDMEV